MVKQSTGDKFDPTNPGSSCVSAKKTLRKAPVEDLSVTFMSDLQEARRRGFLSKMPSYNSVFRYLEADALTPYLYELIATSALPLIPVESDFAIDSSGFSTGQFMRWLDVKYGKEEDRRQWLRQNQHYYVS